jgi:hypothetical protein
MVRMLCVGALVACLSTAWGDDKEASFEELVPPVMVAVSKIDPEAGVVWVQTVRANGTPKYKGEANPPARQPEVIVVQLNPKAEFKGLQFRGGFTDTAGKAVAAADALKRLKVLDVVLLSGDGGKVHPLYLNAVKADTLVLTLERQEAPKLPPSGGIKVVPKDK